MGRQCPLRPGSKALPALVFGDALEWSLSPTQGCWREAWLPPALLHGIFTVGPTHRPSPLPWPTGAHFSHLRVLSAPGMGVSISPGGHTSGGPGMGAIHTQTGLLTCLGNNCPQPQAFTPWLLVEVCSTIRKPGGVGGGVREGSSRGARAGGTQMTSALTPAHAMHVQRGATATVLPTCGLASGPGTDMGL